MVHGSYSAIGKMTDKAMNRIKVHYFGRACEPDFTTNGLSPASSRVPETPIGLCQATQRQIEVVGKNGFNGQMDSGEPSTFQRVATNPPYDKELRRQWGARPRAEEVLSGNRQCKV